MQDFGIFDYVIVGAGAAGCVLANRLSEDADVSVLLLEAGGRDNYIWVKIPVGYLYCMGNKRTDWRYRTEAQAGLNGRALNYPRGRILGGCTAINGMIYMRGQARDYDQWRQMGNPGWAWDDILPYFRRSEDHVGGSNDLHGAGGPWRVEGQRLRWDLLDAFRDAAAQAGIPKVADFNQGNNEGVGYFQVNQRRGWRVSSATAFLRPVLSRKNLTVMTEAQAERVLLEGRRATGVALRRAGVAGTVMARREVILSAGAIGSPQLLQLSGIGPAQHLQDMGIPVIRDMPAVGANLHDHFNTAVSWRCSKPITLNDLENSWPRKIMAGLQYGLFRSGPMTGNGVTAGVFTRSDPRLERPDIQINLMEWSTKERSRDAVIPHDFPGFTLTPVHLRTEGRGSVRLTSPDPFAWPAVLFDYLRTENDIRAALFGLRLVRTIAAQPALKPYVVDEIFPGLDIQSDAALLDYTRRTGVSNQHPTSSCAMGTGPNAVVDPRLRVFGIAGLRVADASIMPVVVGGNTNAPTIMIGEKAAAMILQDAAA